MEGTSIETSCLLELSLLLLCLLGLGLLPGPPQHIKTPTPTMKSPAKTSPTIPPTPIDILKFEKKMFKTFLKSFCCKIESMKKLHLTDDDTK